MSENNIKIKGEEIDRKLEEIEKHITWNKQGTWKYILAPFLV